MVAEVIVGCFMLFANACCLMLFARFPAYNVFVSSCACVYNSVEEIEINSLLFFTKHDCEIAENRFFLGVFRARIFEKSDSAKSCPGAT